MVYARRELRDSDLPSDVPPAIYWICNEVISFLKALNDQIVGQIGLHVVFTEDNNQLGHGIHGRHTMCKYMVLMNVLIHSRRLDRTAIMTTQKGAGPLMADYGQ